MLILPFTKSVQVGNKIFFKILIEEISELLEWIYRYFFLFKVKSKIDKSKKEKK